MQSDPAKIAAGLSEAQKWVLLHIGEAPLVYVALHGLVRKRMFDKGLLSCVDPRQRPTFMQITLLGLQVRAHLKGTSDEENQQG